MSNYPAGFREPPTEEDYYQSTEDFIAELQYKFAEACEQLDQLAAELAKVKDERDRLQKRIDSGIRVRTSKAHYDYSDQLIWANNEDDDKYNNSTIILDEGVKL